MNKFSISIIAAATGMCILLGSINASAQSVDSVAKKVGDKTASTAVKGAAHIKDKVYKGKEAPDGSLVYIDNKDRKYYVDKKGKKIFLKPMQIKDKND